MANLLELGLGLMGNFNSNRTQAEAAGAAGAITAANTAQGRLDARQSNAESYKLLADLYGAQRGDNQPAMDAGRRALLDYEYLVTGRRPNTGIYDSADYKAQSTQRRTLQDRLNNLRTSAVSPTTIYTPTVKTRPGGGWLNPKIHTWTENTATTQTMEQAQADRDKEIASVQFSLQGMGVGSGQDNEAYDRAWTAPELKNSEFYNFQAESGSRGLANFQQRTGKFGSGAGMASMGDFYRKLGAEDSLRQEERYLNLIKQGAGAAGAMGGAAQQAGQTGVGANSSMTQLATDMFKQNASEGTDIAGSVATMNQNSTKQFNDLLAGFFKNQNTRSGYGSGSGYGG